MDFIVSISGDAEGPFNIYYDTVSSGTLVASNVSKSTLVGGYAVTIAGNPTSIIVVNTDSDCQNSETYYLPTATPTPTPVPTATPTPTPTFVLNCTLWGGSVTLASVTPTPTPTATPTPTPAPTSTATPTPTPTGTLVRQTAGIELNSISPSSVFEVSNGTPGGTINNISIVSPGTTAYGRNYYYILEGGVVTNVTFRVSKTNGTALDAGTALIAVNGSTYQSYNFNLGEAIDFYFYVDVTSSDLVTIQIWEG